MANAENLIGKGFKPGQSGNPAGRPKGIPNAATRYKRFLELTEKVKNPVTGIEEKMTVAEVMDLMVIAKARKGDLAAYKEILDRLEGKATETVKMNTQTNMQVIMHDQARDESAFNKKED